MNETSSRVPTSLSKRARRNTPLWAAAAALAVGCAGFGASWAQEATAPQLENVDERTGVRVNSFILRPELRVEGVYSDNYLQSEDDEQSSYLFVTRPEVTLESDWRRHALILSAFGEYGLYTEDSDDNYTEFGGSAIGVIDITRAAGVRIETGLSRLSDGRGDDNAPGAAAEPTEYTLGEIDIEGRYKRGRLRLSPVAAFSLRDYDDVDLIGGGSSNEDDRDRLTYVGGAEIGYEFLRGYEAFVRGEGLLIDYNGDFEPGETDRSGDSLRALGGVNLSLSRLVEGRVGVGYEQRSFDEDDLESVDSVSVDLGVDWFVTPLTSIQFIGEGGVGETTVAGSSGTSRLAGTVSVRHALRRNVLLGGFVGAGTEDFDGVERTDDTLSAGASVEWLLNPNVSLGARYAHTNEDSDAEGESYTENQFSLGLRARY
ncbi:MAG: outer membrane beta-barrel protein [Pseudomonadota bacterium]